jgi:hypothetical protein
VEEGLLTSRQVEELLELQKKEGTRLIKLALEKAYVSEQDMAVSMGRVLKVSPVNLSRLSIPLEIATKSFRDAITGALRMAKIKNPRIDCIAVGTEPDPAPVAPTIRKLTGCRRIVHRKEGECSMVGGLVRYACYVLVFLAVIHAPYYSIEELENDSRRQREYFGSISFPTFGIIQFRITRDSLTGTIVRENLEWVLIKQVPPKAAAPAKPAPKPDPKAGQK